MCRCPIKVLTPKLKAGTYISGADKEYLLVPCGHCEECNLKKQNDLIFRAYYEYLSCQHDKGFVLFQTLTYSEDNVPLAGGFRFFRKKDLQKFLKRLRKRLCDDGYNVLLGQLKYLVTCEYGSKHYRPHYHFLFFVHFDIDPAAFDSYVRECWSNLDGKQRIRIGFVDRSNINKRIVNSIYLLEYVCKYVTKGTEVAKAIKKQPYTDISNYVNQYCFSTGGRITWKELQDYQLTEIWHAFSYQHPEYNELQLLPFYLQSRGLGMDFLETCSYEDLFEVIKIPSKSPTGFKDFHLPMYYIRKVFFDYDKNSKRFILNELGRDYKENVYKSMSDSYEDLFSQNRFLIDDVYRKLFSKQYSWKSFGDCLNSLLGNRSTQDFIDYVLYLKDRRISPLHYWILSEDVDKFWTIYHDFCHIVKEDAIDQLIYDEPFYLYSKYNNPIFDEFGNMPPASRFERLTPMYNDLKFFKNFNLLFDIMQSIKKEFSVYRSAKLEIDREDSNNVKLAKSIIEPYNAVYF